MQMCLRRGCGRVPRAFDETCVSLADCRLRRTGCGRVLRAFDETCVSLADCSLRHSGCGRVPRAFDRTCVSLADCSLRHSGCGRVLRAFDRTCVSLADCRRAVGTWGTHYVPLCTATCEAQAEACLQEIYRPWRRSPGYPAAAPSPSVSARDIQALAKKPWVPCRSPFFLLLSRQVHQ